CRTWRLAASSAGWIATDAMSISAALRAMRSAISPRLAMRTLRRGRAEAGPGAGAWLAMGELPVVDSTAAAGGWPTGRNGVRLTSVRIGAGAMPVKKGSREEGPDTAGDGRHEWRGSASR